MVDNLLKKYFDESYYISQIVSADIISDPLKHYIEYGRHKRLSPNVLFDPEYYLEMNKDVLESGIEPFEHFLNNGMYECRQFHPLIDIEYINNYCSKNNINIKNNIFDHLNFSEIYIQPHILFNKDAYKEDLNNMFCRDEILFKHFLKYGGKNKKSCCKGFDNKFYIENYHIGGNDIPIIHYIKFGYKLKYKFNPVFDVDYYGKLNCIDVTKTNPLIHFYSQFLKTSYNKFFDSDAYHEYNKDLKSLPKNAMLNHYLEYGYKEQGRNKINKFYSIKYIYNYYREIQFKNKTAYQIYFSTKERDKILLIGHEASLTGAPLILLNIIRELYKEYNYDMYIVLLRKGELINEFQKYGHVIYADDFNNLNECLSYIDKYVGISEFKYAIVNSFECRYISDIFSNSNMKNVLLCHELMDCYYKMNPSYESKYVNQFSNIIFPAKIVKENFLQYFDYNENNTFIYHQALNNAHFCQYVDRDKCRITIRKELHIPEHAKIVLACGTVDYRKGSDLFLQCAILYYQCNPDAETYFVWIGLSSSDAVHLNSWIKFDLERLGLRERVLFIGERRNTEPYFAAADLFLLTSRSDPFPCVGQEAMASRLPIICFAGTGGIAEVVEEKGLGFVVPYPDARAMAIKAKQILSGTDDFKPAVEAAYAYQRKYFNITQYTDSILSVLEQDRFERIEIIDSKPIKLFIATPCYSISGINSVNTALIRHLDKSRFNPFFVFSLGQHTIYDDENLIPDDVPRIFLHPDSSKVEDVAACMAGFLEEHAPCIFMPGFDYAASSCAPQLSGRVGIVGVLQANDSEHYEHMQKWGNYWQAIVCVEQDIYETAKEMMPQSVERMSVINNAVETHAYERLTNFNFRDGTTPTLIYTGRMERFQKRIFDYATAIESLEKLHLPFHFVFIGEGSEKMAMERRLKRFVHSGKVDFIDRIPQREVRNYLQRAHFFVQMSDFEGQSLSLLEAMEAGCIPICYPYSRHLSSIVQQGKTGFITQSKKICSFCNLFKKIIKMDNLCEISKNAHDYILNSSHNAEYMARQYENIFINLLNTKVKNTK